jgi:hypothetical protein
VYKRQPLIRLKSGDNIAAFSANDQPLVYLPSGKRSGPNDLHPLLVKDAIAMNFLQLLGLKSAKEAGNAPEIEFREPMPMVEFIRGLDHLLRDTDPFYSKLNWSVEFGQRWLCLEFPGSLWNRVAVTAAKLRRVQGSGPRLVYVAFRATNEHRFHLSIKDWTSLCYETDEEVMLMLISGAASENPLVNLMKEPVKRIKKGRFISDPVGFNFFDEDN